jgi:hypothetical protein
MPNGANQLRGNRNATILLRMITEKTQVVPFAGLGLFAIAKQQRGTDATLGHAVGHWPEKTWRSNRRAIWLRTAVRSTSPQTCPSQSLDSRSFRNLAEVDDCAEDLLDEDALLWDRRPKMMLYVTGS